MADNVMPEAVKSFAEKARAEGWSDEDILGYMKEHQAPQKTPSFWQQHPNMAEGTRQALRLLPVGGAIAGGTIGTGVGPEGTVGGAMLGAAGGTSLANAGEEFLGLSKPRGLIRGAQEAANSASEVGLTTAAGPLIGRGMEKTGDYLEDLGARAGKKGIDLLPGGKLASLAMSDAVRFGGGKMADIGRILAGAGGREPLLTRPPEQEAAQRFAEGVMTRPTLPKLLGEGPTQLPRTTDADASFIRSIPAEPPVRSRLALPGGREPVASPPSSLSDPSFVRGVPAEPMRVERLSLPEGRTPIEAGPAPDTSGIRVTPAAKTEFPVRDPGTGRMRRVFTSESASPVSTQEEVAQGVKVKAPSPFEAKVKALATEGHDAGSIADALKESPEFEGLTKVQRTNLVRDVRGGPSGGMSPKLKDTLDGDMAKLTTAAQKKDYLSRAKNAMVREYVKEQLGL